MPKKYPVEIRKPDLVVFENGAICILSKDRKKYSIEVYPVLGGCVFTSAKDQIAALKVCKQEAKRYRNQVKEMKNGKIKSSRK